jgi:hypothetical protein
LPESQEYAKSGFVAFVDEGRLWVVRDGSKDLAN